MMYCACDHYLRNSIRVEVAYLLEQVRDLDPSCVVTQMKLGENRQYFTGITVCLHCGHGEDTHNSY